MIGCLNPLSKNPPLEGLLLNLVGAEVPELVFTVWSTGGGVSCLGKVTGGGMTRGGDITVGALRSWVSEK